MEMFRSESYYTSITVACYIGPPSRPSGSTMPEGVLRGRRFPRAPRPVARASPPPSELLPLRWTQVDLDAGIVRLERGATKNREGRIFQIGAMPDLVEVFRAQRAYTDRVQRERGAIVAHVLHRDGRPIRDFRDAWQGACERAGLIRMIPHDFRRSAVRNLERAGVPRSVAMKLVGHQTESIYRRYAIVCEKDLAEGAAKLAALHARQPESPRTGTVRAHWGHRAG